MTVQTIETDICLFDLDGTIVNTIVAAESAWIKLCKLYNVDSAELFKVSHGSRTQEMLARFFPMLDNTGNKAVDHLERDIADNYLETIKVIPGARELLLALDRDPFSNGSVNFKERESKRKWAIITSGSPYIAYSWFRTILQDVGSPFVFITSEDVMNGKPDPEGYAKARDQLAEVWNYKSPCRAVVFEDAPVGIKAGNLMNAVTIGITTSHSKEKLFEAGADFVVEDLTAVTVIENSLDGSIKLLIKDSLQKD